MFDVVASVVWVSAQFLGGFGAFVKLSYRHTVQHTSALHICSLTDKLQISQNNIGRIVLDLKPRAHVGKQQFQYVL